MIEKHKHRPDDRTQDIEERGGGNKVDLDRILLEETGQFGKYQMRTIGIALIVSMFAAWTSSEYLFTTARIATRCLIPECESHESAEFSPSWVLNAVPVSGSSFDNCQRYEAQNSTEAERGYCPDYWFNRDTTLACEEYVYENSHSIVYDYGMACDEWRRTLIGSARTAGTLVALPITGYISDHWGRRIALIFNAVNGAWIGTVRYFADTYIGFLVSEVVEAVCGSAAFSCVYISMMELVGPKYRVAVGATMTTFFSVGQIMLGLIAWAVPNWKKLTLALYIPQFLTISYFWIVSESIRWYLSKGRYEEAGKVLKDVARVNGKELSQKSLDALRETAEKAKLQAAILEEQKNNEPALPILVFRHKQIFKRVLVSPIWWITMTLIYYGLSINSVNMSGNRYLNYVAVCAVEIPGFWTSVFLMGKIGRKLVLTCAYWSCAACQLAYIFMPEGMYGVSLTVYLIGKYSIAMVATSLYVYTAELYPTKYRHSLFAFSSMVGRIGSIVAPMTPAFAAAVWDDLPFALFGGFALLSGFLVLITPETLGTKLPDTMEEASTLGVKKIP